MKRFIALALALTMIFAFAACSKAPATKANEKYVIINEELGAEEYGIAFRSDDQETADYIQTAVYALVESGKYAEIAANYDDVKDNLIFLAADFAIPEAKVDITKAEKRTFTMGIDPEYPPFSYLDDNGDYTGFDVEICKAACELLGWDFEVFGVNWDEKLVQLDAKECDCVWAGMTILDSMTEAGYIIADPYYYNTQVVVVKESSGITKAAELEGKTVAVMLGTSGETLLAEDGDLADLSATFGTLTTCESFLKCFTELEGNAVDAVFVDLPVATSWVNDKNS